MVDLSAHDSAPATLNLDAFLPYRLSVLTNRISTRIARTYAERFALTIPEWRVIAVLGREAGLTANDVAERTAMDKVMVSRAVRRLLVQGRVLRRIAAKDRRSASLTLTAKGRAIYLEIVPLALSIEQELLSSLSEGEARALDRALQKLSQAVSPA